jgi:hypothetical protein
VLVFATLALVGFTADRDVLDSSTLGATRITDSLIVSCDDPPADGPQLEAQLDEARVTMPDHDPPHLCPATDDTIAGCPACLAAAETVAVGLHTYDPKEDGNCSRCTFAALLHCVVCRRCASSYLLPDQTCVICGMTRIDAAHDEAALEDYSRVEVAHAEALTMTAWTPCTQTHSAR